MGIAERKERDKQEMHEKIVQAATRMFAEEGYEKTSIRGIAERIEYSPATIYLYFKDKDELLYAVQEEAFKNLLGQFKELATIQDPVERLRRLGFTYLEFALKNPEHYTLMFVLNSPMRTMEEHAKWQTGVDTFGVLHQTIQQCMDIGRIKPGNSELISMSMWALVHGLATLNISCRFQIFQRTDEEIRLMMLESLRHTFDTLIL